LPRKPTDVAHVNLRIREGLRRRLEADAKRRRVSLNSGIMLLLETALLDKPRDDFATIAMTLTGDLERLEATQELLALGDLVMEELKSGGGGDEIVERVKVLVAGPVQKWCAIRELVNQRDREERLKPEESAP
jgi:hypothetical protein